MVTIWGALLIAIISFIALVVILGFSFGAFSFDPCKSPDRITANKSSSAAKIEPGLHAKVVCMTEHNINDKHGIIIFVRDENKSILAEKRHSVHNADSVVIGQRLSFTTARVPVQEIIKIAEYDFVGLIGDGEVKGQPT